MPGSSDNPRSGSAVASGREFASSFFKSVLILTSPLYLLTALTSNGKQLMESKSLQGGLYISLATLIPMVSALLVTSGKEERYQLCLRCFRFYRDKWLWYSIAGLGGPFLYALSYYTVIILYPNQTMAGPMISPGQITILVPSIIVIHIMAATEEIGWMGYAFPAMMQRSNNNALRTSIQLGICWALWHVPFFFFLFPEPKAISVPCQALVLLSERIILCWIYQNSHGSVSAVILYHAMDNVALLVGPDVKGLSPVVPCLYAILSATFVVLLNDGKTLTCKKVGWNVRLNEK